MYCKQITLDGTRCKRRLYNKDYCKQHLITHSSKSKINTKTNNRVKSMSGGSSIDDIKDTLSLTVRDINKLDNEYTDLEKIFRGKVTDLIISKNLLISKISKVHSKIPTFRTIDEIKSLREMLEKNNIQEYLSSLYPGGTDINFSNFTFFYAPDMLKNKNIKKENYPYGASSLGDYITLSNRYDIILTENLYEVKNGIPHYKLCEDNSYTEVIRFEKDGNKFVLDDPNKARYSGYHGIFWLLKGIYYYPCRGSGLFLKTGRVITGFNKLHVLTLLGFDVIDAIKKSYIGKYSPTSFNQLPYRCDNNSGVCELLVEYFTNFAEKCQGITQRFKNFSNLLEFFDFGKKQTECKNKYNSNKSDIDKCIDSVYADYKTVFTGKNLAKINSSTSDSEKNMILKEYGTIYDAKIPPVHIDITIYDLAKGQGYNQIFLTHEPDDAGGFGCELIDLEELSTFSTIKLERF